MSELVGVERCCKYEVLCTAVCVRVLCIMSRIIVSHVNLPLVDLTRLYVYVF